MDQMFTDAPLVEVVPSEMSVGAKILVRHLHRHIVVHLSVAIEPGKDGILAEWRLGGSFINRVMVALYRAQHGVVQNKTSPSADCGTPLSHAPCGETRWSHWLIISFPLGKHAANASLVVWPFAAQARKDHPSTHSRDSLQYTHLTNSNYRFSSNVIDVHTRYLSILNHIARYFS